MKQPVDGTVKFFVVTIGTIILALVLKELQAVFIPFVIAYILYFLFAPLNNTLLEKKVPTIAVILFDVIVILFISVGLSRILVESVLQFSNEWQNYTNTLNNIVRDTSASLGIKDPYFRSFSLQKIIAKIDYKELAGSLFSSAFSITGSALLTIFFFAFIVSGHQAVYVAFKRRFSAQMEQQAADAAADSEGRTAPYASLESTVNEITRQIQKYIVAKTAMNLGAGISVGLLLLAMNVDFILIWGVFVFLLNFIPSIGAVIALILPSVMATIQHQSLGYGLLTAGLIALIQTLFFNILEPMLIGKRLGLNPIIILLSVLLWGYIWGIVGMLLAIPLTAIIKIIISNSNNQNLKFIVDLMDED
ncbi:MAG: AI-2E family transporter [Ignavibacteria bacterium]|nr:AI-2E family transporter [Ignavibacteria bacterium]